MAETTITLAVSKPCHVCEAQTLFACSDCRIDLGVSVHVCPTRTCRTLHEEKCPARLREQIKAMAALKPKRLRDGEPCAHTGCLRHLSHPCEGCGRIAGRRTLDQVVTVAMMVFPDTQEVCQDICSILSSGVTVGKGSCMFYAWRSAANAAEYIIDMQGGSTTPGFANQYVRLHPEIVKIEE